MSEAEQVATIRRILALPKNADPFAILGLDVTTKKPTTTTGGADEASATASSSAAVEEEVTYATVKKAYRRISLLLHPDKCSVPKGTDAFSVVDIAYKRLPDEQSVERFKVQIQRKIMKEEQDRKRQEEAMRESREAKAGSVQSYAGLTVAQRKQLVLDAADESRREFNARRGEEIQRKQAAVRERNEKDETLSTAIADQQQQWSDLGF